MKMTVLVPTYRRPKDLARCLAALQHQDRAPDEVLVTVRHTDEDTWKFLATFDRQNLPLKVLPIDVPGVVAAMNLGFDSAQGDIISVTDDDAVPRPDWLAQIEAGFLNDPQIGGIGGRDWLYHGAILEQGTAQVVGRVQWFGRVIGNHHLGIGSAREVDILKGVNMSFRKSALAGLRCDERLKGTGAQVHFEIALSLSVKQRGWKLIYDPAVTVDHYSAERFDEDQRHQFSYIACLNKVHNETVAILDHIPAIQQLIYLIWAIAIGTRDAFGVAQLLRFLPSEGTLALQKWAASIQGRWQGIHTIRTPLPK